MYPRRKGRKKKTKSLPLYAMPVTQRTFVVHLSGVGSARGTLFYRFGEAAKLELKYITYGLMSKWDVHSIIDQSTRGGHCQTGKKNA